MKQIDKVRMMDTTPVSAIGSFPLSSLFSKVDLGVEDDVRYTVFPGFCDVHVHFREPGFSYKETVETGSRAAARGGYTAVCTMANLNPVPDSVENLKKQLSIIEKDACIHIYPYGAITVGQKGETLAYYNIILSKNQTKLNKIKY